MEKGGKILATEQRWSLNRYRRVEKDSHEGDDIRVGELRQKSNVYILTRAGKRHLKKSHNWLEERMKELLGEEKN